MMRYFVKKELLTRPDIKLVGLTIRTNNKNETNPQTARIGELISRYWNQQLSSHIQNRKNPGVSLSVYTEFESDEHGDYTYFIGEEVSSFENIPSEMKALTIPASKYQKFTTSPGAMPNIVINAWQQIWKMSPDEVGGKRAYQADFEVYDQRAMDPQQAIVDIYIGIV